ncbi:Golgi-specific brefeldin A-resistance guanine nucleotide exchange factor [Trichinella pseudospiralis]
MVSFLLFSIFAFRCGVWPFEKSHFRMFDTPRLGRCDFCSSTCWPDLFASILLCAMQCSTVQCNASYPMQKKTVATN